MNPSRTNRPPRVACTSPRRSFRLMDAGLDAATADHSWWIPRSKDGKPLPARFRAEPPAGACTWTPDGRQLPAWSAGALADAARDILPKERRESLLASLTGEFRHDTEVIRDMADAILEAKPKAKRKKEGEPQHRSAPPLQRDSWPTGGTTPQPFRARLSLWWSQRPWARHNRP